MFLVVTACGAGADHLATSIDNATAAAKDGSKQDPEGTSSAQTSSTGGTTVTVETKVTVTTGELVHQVNGSDELDGTNWVSTCENGITYSASFTKGVETLTTNVYQDGACRSVAQSIAQYINYAIQGDDIQFGEAKAGVYANGEPFQVMNLDNDTLSFSGNDEQVFKRI